MAHRTIQRRRLAAVVAATGLAITAISPGTAAAATVNDTGVDGLIGPLGLAIGNDGTVYVAEAFAGRLTAISPRGERSTLVQLEGEETFLTGVAAVGRGQVAYTATVIPEFGTEDDIDTTFNLVNPNGKVVRSVSTWAYEAANNPDGHQWYGFLETPEECLALLPGMVQPYQGGVESNPYAITAVPGGHLIADAAGNSILHVAANGRITTVAVLPPIPTLVDADLANEFGLNPCVIGETYWGEPVPTDVEVGPDGMLYVTTLPGQPELPGTASVYRVHPRTGAVELAATGFSGAVDLAVAADGTIYVAELFAGQISAIHPDGTVSVVAEVPTPGAIEIDRRGVIYATTGVFGPGGSLVTITP
jgi:outer membrane protein assembly factor BamB